MRRSPGGRGRTAGTLLQPSRGVVSARIVRPGPARLRAEMSEMHATAHALRTE